MPADQPHAAPGLSATPSTGRSCILTINGGSSSLKFALFEQSLASNEARPQRTFSGKIDRIGLPEATFRVGDGAGKLLEERRVEAADQRAAVGLLIDWIDSHVGFASVAAVGHRVVHGGGRYVEPAVVTAPMLDALRTLSPFDPDHLPGELALIEAFQALDPARPQVACFDTAFHRDLPRVARIVPIPRRYEALGVRRYGFHGLSYAYLMEELDRVAGPQVAAGRVILAHLGSGASLAAVLGGRCVETTMGLTPAGGLVMGTRSGDLDPGVGAFLARVEGVSAEQFDRLANRESGLLGVSETSPDLRDLLARAQGDVRAAEAVELFCYRVKTGIGALAAALGGLDALVFAGGIGENAPEVRARICAGLEFLGVELDPERNPSAAPLLSADRGRVQVRVIRTDEELTIARAVAAVLRSAAAAGSTGTR
jgi:acetate kinase